MVGRIAAIHDRLHEATHRDGAGFFGFFESEDDPEVAGALLDAAAAYLRTRGEDAAARSVQPLDQRRGRSAGERFRNAVGLMMPRNPAYYPALLEAAGFRKLKDLLAFESTDNALPARLVAATGTVERRYGVSTRPIEMWRFAEEIELVKRLFNTGWRQNWGAVPLEAAEIAELARQLKPIVVPDLVIFAERRASPSASRPRIPDMNVALRANPSGRLFPGLLKVLWAARRITRLRVLLLGVLPQWRGRGLDALLYRRIWENGRARGYDWAEAGWVLEDNQPIINGLRRMGFRVYKTYRVYERPI